MSNNKSLMPTLLGKTGIDPETSNDPNPQTPGCSGGKSSSAGPLEAGAAIHNQTPSNTKPHQETFARYLTICHRDKDKDITKFNSFAIQKALSVLIGNDFYCQRYERFKLVEILVHTARQSNTLLELTELDCTEFVIPVQIQKHKSKNSCKGVVHSKSICNTDKHTLMSYMADYQVTDIYRLSKTENGVTELTNTHILTFNCDTPPKIIDFGFGEKVDVHTYYPNPRLCRNCQRYGHGANSCNNKLRCAKCGSEGHSSVDCDTEISCCFYCKENHPTTSKLCPRYKLEKRVLKQMTDDRSSPFEARKLVYRDSQDLICKIPSLSNYVVKTYSKVVIGNPHVISANSKNPNPTALQNTPTPTQQTHDPSHYFDHPLFKSMVDQQQAMAKQQTELLAQQQQNTALMQTMMGIMGSMVNLFTSVFSQSLQPHPLNSQQIQQF